ncbi:MAG TPA: PAS domain-containing protein [Opitutaceae bacterium]|nr:PAS domain-containing protein [Opitutaceae bacterium]
MTLNEHSASALADDAAAPSRDTLKPAASLAGIDSFAEITPDLFAVIEQPNYQVEYLNPAGRALLGLTPDEKLEERSLMEFIPGQCLWTLLNDAIPTAWRVGTWTGDLELRTHDGREIATSVNLIARAASPSNGPHDRLWIVARDISPLRKTIDSLKREQWFLRTLLENVPDYIYFKDLSSRFVRVSHSMSSCFGISDPKQIEGKCDFDFFTYEHAQPAFDAEQEIIRTERPVVGIEEKETWADGRVTWVTTTKLPLYNEYGQVIGTFGISRDITRRKHTEQALAQAQRNLLETSRLAGMAEVASGVLHNIGNAFNSVNTSTALVADQVSKLKVANLGRAVAMIQENLANLPAFITEDPRGKQLPNYLAQLSIQLSREHQSLATEITSLSRSVEHIKNIIAMQQSYVRASSLVEDLAAPDVIMEALQISEASLTRHQVNVVKDFSDTPRVRAARHKVLQILVNLIGNAKQAVGSSGREDKRITISVRLAEKDHVRIGVRDNGVGIPAENLQRIFSFGFTTKTNGHGFGLHSSAIAAQEMGGSLIAQSGGQGQGAEFILELPIAKPAPSS